MYRWFQGKRVYYWLDGWLFVATNFDCHSSVIRLFFWNPISFCATWAKGESWVGLAFDDRLKSSLTVLTVTSRSGKRSLEFTFINLNLISNWVGDAEVRILFHLWRLRFNDFRILHFGFTRMQQSALITTELTFTTLYKKTSGGHHFLVDISGSVVLVPYASFIKDTGQKLSSSLRIRIHVFVSLVVLSWPLVDRRHFKKSFRQVLSHNSISPVNKFYTICFFP